MQTLAKVPQGWQLENRFRQAAPPKSPIVASGKDAATYFASGYHDGFVKPLEKHTPTMEIEMRRIRSPKHPNYASSWEIGGSSWAKMSKNEPAYLESLKPYLKDGSVEIVGGTWSEPLCLTISGEANLRQFMYGMEAIEKHLGIKIRVYMNQEHGTFAQMPQILSSFGLKAAVNRTHWAPFGYESGLDADVAQWLGPDGSKILVIPRYTFMDYATYDGDGKNQQNGGVTGHARNWRTAEKFKEVRDKALACGVTRPLTTMLEDIWSVELRSSDAEMDFYASLPFVRFTSVSRYLKMYGL